jgi:hypothetical protein
LLYGKLLRLHQHCICLWRKPRGLIAWAHGARACSVTIAPQGPSCNVNTVCSSSPHAALLSVNPPDHRVYSQTSTMYRIFFLLVILGLSAADIGIANVAFAPSRRLFGRQASNSSCDGCLGMKLPQLSICVKYGRHLQGDGCRHRKMLRRYVHFSRPGLLPNRPLQWLVLSLHGSMRTLPCWTDMLRGRRIYR